MWKQRWVCLLILAAVWGITADCSSPAKMMIICVWIFLVVKWQSLQRVRHSELRLSKTDVLIWVFLTPTLDAEGFFGDRRPAAERPRAGNWCRAAVMSICGAALFLGLAPVWVQESPLIAGWIAMIGLVTLLHFGLLELFVLFWQSRGRGVRPLMNRPLLAKSLSDFWGRRWNSAFRDFAHQQIFRPLSRHWNASAATLLCFIFSGLIHDLAISVPAGGGYGFPTAYFFLQSIGMAMERKAARSGWAQRFGIGNRLFTILVLVVPVGMLFHPPFVRNVIVPLI